MTRLHTFALRLSLVPTVLDLDGTHDEAGFKALAVQTELLIDGHSLLPPSAASLVIDLADVVLAGEFADDYEPLTCSCGYAGCAGIDEPVTVQHQDRRVVWSFPATTYGERLAKVDVAQVQDAVIRFEFDALAYQAEVERALVQIETWQRYHVVPVVIPPHDRVLPNDVVPIRTSVAQWRKSFEAWRARGRRPIVVDAQDLGL